MGRLGAAAQALVAAQSAPGFFYAFGLLNLDIVQPSMEFATSFSPLWRSRRSWRCDVGRLRRLNSPDTCRLARRRRPLKLATLPAPTPANWRATIAPSSSGVCSQASGVAFVPLCVRLTERRFQPSAEVR